MSCQRVLPDALPPGDVVELSDHLHLNPVPRLVGSARRFVRDRLPPALDEDVTDALLLMTSELVTNAVIHARTAIELGVTVSRESVLVTVHDQDLARPAQQPYSDRDGGRGLDLVRALSEQYAVERHEDDGKTVWFRVRRAGGGAALGVVEGGEQGGGA
ncbi:MAG TPA: ATP-binding protein [Mycobacteriales bacterium]|nr:ATP-binding protein [Mycobacteriales bacterium]